MKKALQWSEKNEICGHLSRLAPGQRPNKPERAGATRVKRQPVPCFLLNSLVEGLDTESSNASS